MGFSGVFDMNGIGLEPQFNWSTGRELNPRILVLQTSALATSPPVLIASGAASLANAAPDDYLLCLAGKVLSCQVPGFHLQPCSAAIGALARVFHRRRRGNNHRIARPPVRRH